MDTNWAQSVLLTNLLAHMVLIAGALWCIAFPAHRVYPLSGKNFWYYSMWTLFNFIFLSNAAFILLDWSTGPWTSSLRSRRLPIPSPTSSTRWRAPSFSHSTTTTDI